MKLSVLSSYFLELSPEDAIIELSNSGIHYTELSDEHGALLIERGNPVEVGKAFGLFAKEHGVEVLQGHLWLGATICDRTGKSVEILKNWLDLYDAIGIKAAILHCDRIRTEPDISCQERIDRNIEVLKELCNYIEGREINLCIENTRSDFPLTGNAEEIIYIIDRVGSKNLSICLDTGHLNLCTDTDQEKFILTCGSLLTALHIADNDRSTDQHILPYGRGNVNWDIVMKSLKKIGYDGLFNYEVPSERNAPMSVKKAKLEYIKAISAYLETI